LTNSAFLEIDRLRRGAGAGAVRVCKLGCGV